MIRLAQILPPQFPLIRQWAQDTAMEQYFRRFPPTFNWASDEQVGQYLQSTYMILEEDAPIGIVSLGSFDPQNKRAELGIAIDPAKCRKRARAAFEASYQLCDYAFNYLGYKKIFTLVIPERKDIARLLCTFCFKPEGLLRANLFWRGEYHDEVLFALLDTDFRRIK